MVDLYLWVKAFHLIAVISWLAGLLYLPRLFVYHAGVAVGSDQDKLFQVMERKLLRYIMNPAMVVSLILGLWLVHITYLGQAYSGWLHVKGLLLVFLFGCHGLMAKFRKVFVEGKNVYSSKFYRIFNEVVTVLMVGIVVLAVVKPF